MDRTVLITGATAGIGRSTALKFAESNDRLILTGRRTKLLDELKEQINTTSRSSVRLLSFDVGDNAAVEVALDSLPEDWKEIDILVNNAGLALGLDPIQESDLADWDRMIDTNVRGLLYVTKKVAPWMAGSGKGHIINIGSIAGREVYPDGGVYCATKYAVDAITQGMRIDMLRQGIRVTQVSPGAVKTEFSIVRFKGDTEKANKVYEGYEPLKPEDIAEIIFFIASLPERINVNDILVMPAAQANATIFNRK